MRLVLSLSVGHFRRAMLATSVLDADRCQASRRTRRPGTAARANRAEGMSDLPRKLLAEALGTALLLGVVIGSGITARQ
jgi:hypothetical protein